MASPIDSSNNLFLELEFKAMDMDEDGFLTKQEVYQLMIFQGVSLTEEEIKIHLSRCGLRLNLSEFVNFMQGLGDSTRKLREIFAMFTKEDQLSADKDDIVKGFEQMGVNNAANIVAGMKSENNRVEYKSFLQVYLRGKFC